MRLAALVVVLAACEKQGPVESTPGAGSSSVGGTATPTVKAIDAGVATVGTDAALVAPVDAAVVAVRPDAAIRLPQPPNRYDSVQMDEESAARIADMLTTDDSTRDAGDMSKRRPGADLGKAIEDAKGGGRTVSIGGGGSRGGARVATGSGPKVDIPGANPSPVDSPRGRITISSKQALDESTLLPEMVISKISTAYMAGLKRCYKTYLQKDATARGKINLYLTVNEAGRAVSPRANGFAAAIDDCIKSQMASWRFPIPKDKDGETTDAAFLIGLQLVPD